MPLPVDAERIILNCAEDNPGAWPEFIDTFSRLVYNSVKMKINKLALRMPETEINDICQQVFLSIWHKQKLKSIKKPKKISSWLITVAQNETINYVRAKYYKIKIVETKEEADMPFIFTTPDEIHKDELEGEIKLFVDRLPLKECRIATLAFLYDLKYSQIAKIVNLPMGTVANTLNRIKAGLKQHLIKKGFISS